MQVSTQGPLPPGYVQRQPRPDDVENVFGVVAACELEDIGLVDIDLEDIVGDWRRPGFDLSRDAVLLTTAEETPVAVAEVFGARADVSVMPQHRDRGLGTWLSHWVESRARQQGASAIRQAAPTTAPATLTLLDAVGYARTGSGWTFRIELKAGDRHRQPQGVHIRNFRPGTDDPRVWHLVDAAFAHWPDRPPGSLERWQGLTVARAGFEPWMLPVMEQDGDVIGMAYCIDYPEEDHVWVHQLAVDPPRQRQGFGEAMLREVFSRCSERGRTSVGLSTDSFTGARSLYERVGMRVTHERVNFRFPLD